VFFNLFLCKLRLNKRERRRSDQLCRIQIDPRQAKSKLSRLTQLTATTIHLSEIHLYIVHVCAILCHEVVNANEVAVEL